MKISEINIYPIKSLGGVSLKESKIEERGLKFDRRWMITDKNGEFLTQREIPKMAVLALQIDETHLIVGCENDSVKIPFEFEKSETQKVRVWRSICDALVLPKQINDWFSDILETNCRLVYMPDKTKREINAQFRQNDEIVSFADGYPFMLIGENSLNDLNEKLETGKLPMNRFRPNFVVSESDAFAEDNWKNIRIGKTVFRSTKPCARCVMTTIDQEHGDFDGKEPLKTLAKYRKAKDVFPNDFERFGLEKNHILFGQNLVAENIGDIIKIGDELEVLEDGTPLS